MLKNKAKDKKKKELFACAKKQEQKHRKMDLYSVLN
jgi:hypothetical protein